MMSVQAALTTRAGDTVNCAMRSLGVLVLLACIVPGAAEMNRLPPGLKVGVVQMALGRTLAENRDRIVAGISNAAARGVRVAVFPESALRGTDGNQPELVDQAVAAVNRKQASPAHGPLRVHPTNPRYFTDGTTNRHGLLRAVYLTGSHHWYNLQDSANLGKPLTGQFDYDGYLARLARPNHNFIRMWSWEVGENDV